MMVNSDTLLRAPGTTLRSVTSLFIFILFCAVTTATSSRAEILSDTPRPYDVVHRGGTLRLAAAASGGTLDPQINYSSQYINLFANVYDGLTTFKKAQGPDGNIVVPDLAENTPVVQDNGRTYIFTLRPGLFFSDGKPVTTADVKASFQRIFKVGSPSAGSFYSAIAGADLCLKTPATCTLSAGITDDPLHRTITFHLTGPDNEFLQKLAFTHAVILPADAPDHDTGNTPLPSTGPYRITAYDPNKSLKLERNPYFRQWSAEAQPEAYPDAIEYSFGIPDETAVTAVQNGQYDWMAESIPMDRLGELGSHYAQNTHVMPHAAMYFLAMNVNIPPFNSLKARQAVNYAVNRKAMVIFYGGPGIARPICGMVPSALPGATDFCFYSKAASPDAPVTEWKSPDLEKAQQLVRESGTYGEAVTLITADTSVEMAMGAWIRDMLQHIGYKATLRPLNRAVASGYMQNSANHVQIALKDWATDYPSPSNFLDTLLGCENFHPDSDSSINIPGFCNPDIQRLIDQVKTDSNLTAEETETLWRTIDHMVMAQSPVSPLIEKKTVLITSPRLKNFFYTPVNQLLFSQVWLH